MPASQFAIVYSTATGRVRSFVLFNAEAENDSHLSMVRSGKGEAILVSPIADYGDLSVIQSLVTKATGLVPVDDRYAVVNEAGDVVGALHADPAGCEEAVADHALIKHKDACPGWKYADGEFVRPDPAHVELVEAPL